ncbi:MAG: TetR/AcrR family transcriptional regulator [Pseudomonadota bacterium]|jgi:AcrR family transcriptional regulator|nr:TetR/AcrR family transcriptional regulator [Pseudomonadota bacterium]
MKTRERILKTARELFNARRFGNVTTADLAAECGIAEGNLWYHFKNKRELLEALSDGFLDEVEPRLAMLPSDEASILEDYASMLAMLVTEIRRYRFLYRDQADYGEHTDRLLQRLPGIYRDTLAQFQTYLHGMMKAGHLDVRKDRLANLATNSVIILRYHLEFLRESGADSDAGSGAVSRAVQQHLTLFEDALTPTARQSLELALTNRFVDA